MDEDYNLAERYRIVRKHLDRLGYRQALSLDALPLIERLLADLIQTTDSLKHFKTVAQDNIEACSQLQLATEPYKCDNARLVQECNQLHLKLLETNESYQKQIKELKKQVRKLEIESNDLRLASSRNIKKIKELEAESGGKSAKILELQGKCCKPVISSANLATKKRACFPLRRPTLEADPLPRTGSGSSSTLPSSSNVDPHVVDLLGMADHRMNCLNREVTKLKGDLSIQSDNIHTLKSQLATKEKEIMRLKKMLDGGRPLSAVTKDCFCKKTEKTHFGDIGELKILERAKQDLEEQLKDSMSKQHEAMSRALKLAERNEELEKELRDIDHIALAVEADCNSAVQENNRRVTRLQEKVEDLMTQVHVLESELTVERREAQELRADLEACKLEKRNIQRVLESTLDEKKQMTDRINQLTIMEKDLYNTIERLTREITHLESSNNILKDQLNTNVGGGGGGGDEKEKHKEKGEKNDKNKGKKILKKKPTVSKTQSPTPATNKGSFNGHREDEVSKDVTNAAQTATRDYENRRAENQKDSTIESLKKTIERLETERDYYRNEYNKFREEFNLISNGDNADLWTQACELRRQLNEKEQAMAELQREKKALDREKFNLEARLQTSKSQQRRPCISSSPCSSCRPAGPCNCSSSPASAGDASSTKAMVERLERERDTARADVDRLVEERDALRERLKIAVEAHTSEQRRLRENLSDAETRLKQLETERQDLMLSQGTRRATINGLEDQLEDLRQELRRTKEELTTQRTQYFQLRALQEQTDQALGDVQGQLGQSETELNKMIDHKRNIEQQQAQLDNQVKELKQECNMLRSNLAQLDQEKDQLLMNLDEKTERIAALEREVRFKEQQGNGLEQQVVDFQNKYQICVDQTAEQERQLRAMEVEINNLQRQLASASMDRENAIRENARIQDDLASVTCECRNLQRELEVSRAESYDLKRQLQTYVTEVRRAEDLLNRKENERSEMLNHFRSLSLEATVLETNNQSLESEAAEARGALQTAQDRLLDLERQIADRDCLIRGYETQIAELTQNVASMETQLHQQGEQRKRAEADLNAVRDLCVKLDQQKESLEVQLADKEAMKAQVESQLSRLRTEQNMVQDQMSRDNAAVDRLEAMLNQARQESIGNQATNQELQSEMSRLKQKISDLQNKLLAETSELRRYQNQAAEYSKQISELRRQMTNERFDRARKEEENRRNANTGDKCLQYRADSPHNFAKQTCPPCNAFKSPTPAPRPDPKSVNQWKIPAPRNGDWLRKPYNALPNCPCAKNRSSDDNGATNPQRSNNYSPCISPPTYAVPSPHVPSSVCSNKTANSNSCRTPEESRKGCCGKPDLKKEAQRTNRFNTNSSRNSASPSLTPCSHFESTSGVAGDYKTQEKDDVPCINIILKPILDPKTERKEKDMQIVEVTAITENINKHSIDDTNTSLPDQRQNSSKETKKVEIKCVKVQTEDVKNIHDTSTQTTEAPNDRKSIGAFVPEPEIPEIATGNISVNQRVTDEDANTRNRGVQFRDTKALATDVDSLNQNPVTPGDRDAQFLPTDNSLCNKIATDIINISDLTATLISDNERVETTAQKTSASPVTCFDSIGTLYESVDTEDKSIGRASGIRSCVKKSGQGTQGKLSDRIKRNIDKLEIGSCVPKHSSTHTETTSRGTQRGSMKNETKRSTCNDVCKDIASRVEFFKTYSNKSNGSLVTRDTGTSASVVSNNPPIPHVSIDTTETTDWESPSKNKPSKVTTGTIVTDSSFSPSPDNIPCCSNQNFSIGDISCKARNVTSDEDYSSDVSCEQQYSNDEKITACGNVENKNLETLISRTGTKGFRTDASASLSNLGIDRNSSVLTKSTNTLDEPIGGSSLVESNKFVEEHIVCSSGKGCKSTAVQTNSVSFSETPEYLSTVRSTKFGSEPDSTLSRSNTQKIVTSSDLTRPEFIRMLTELKEHTCSLELQLSAMNEAMKRKQATRIRVLTSTPRKHEQTRQDHLASKTRTEKIITGNEPFFSASELSSIEYARLAPEEFNIENSSNTSCCASTRDNSPVENRCLEDETRNDETCCGSAIISEPNESYTPLKSGKKLKTSSHTVRSAKPEQVVLAREKSNISLSKHRSKKPAFKTKRSYFSAPLRQSDYRLWSNKLQKLTPSLRSMIMPKSLSQSLSPNSFMERSKIDVSCSPTNCCDASATPFQTMFMEANLSSIRKPERTDNTMESSTHSTASNPSVNRTTVRPAFMSSTLKKSVKRSPNTKCETKTENESNSDYKKQKILHASSKTAECRTASTTMVSSCGMNTSEYSNGGEKCCEDEKIEPIKGAAEQTQEHVVLTSSVKVKRSIVRPRIGIKQSSFKSRTKDRPTSIPSNTCLRSSASRKSFYESSSNICSKNDRTRHDSSKPSSFQSTKLRVIPRLKLRSVRSRNHSHSYVEEGNSQARLEPVCCSTAKKGKIISNDESLPAEEILPKSADRSKERDHFAYTIKTEQNTPFLVNNFSKFDSEEEVGSTDYGFNKSGKERCGKEVKDNANDKKRKRNSGGKKLIKENAKSGFISNSHNSEVRNCRNDSQSSQYRERGTNSESIKNSQCISSDRRSEKVQEFDYILGKSNQNNSQQKDSKCTIRVTVSLDDTPSNEEVKKI